jgi:hypothetical protein
MAGFRCAHLLHRAVTGLFDYVKEGDVIYKLMGQYESQKVKIETDLKKCKGALADCGLKRIRLLSAIRDNPQWSISQSNIDLQMTAINEEEERNKAEISKLKSLKNNANQSKELRQCEIGIQ